jgi:hypothetical protein
MLQGASAAHAQFNYTTNGGEITITGPGAATGTATIPETINGWPVTSIETNAFFGDTNLTSVTIPGSVTMVGQNAFALCSALESIYFLGNPPTCAPFAFLGDDIATAYYPPGATGWSANFAELPATSWTDPSELGYTTNGGGITITGYAGPSAVVIIPPTINHLPVTGIGQNFLRGAQSITSLIMPGSISSIGSNVCYLCTGLGALTVPAGVTNIESGAFAVCAGLTNITIANGATTTGDYTFVACSGITHVRFPASLLHFGIQSFSSCYSLTNFTVDAQNPFLSSTNGELFDKDKTTLIAYPNGLQGICIVPSSVVSIAADAFYGCKYLSGAVLPGGLQSIGQLAFFGCGSLTTITIPRGVTNIGQVAFFGLASLGSVFFEGNAPGVGPLAFAADTQTAFYYLPETTGWGDVATNFTSPLIPWNPLVQTADGNLGVRSNHFGFNITGTRNIPIVVEACTNLVNPVWAPLQSLTLTNGSFYFSEPWQSGSGRFYRIRLP